MVIELRKHNLNYLTKQPVEVFYDGSVFGSYRADIIIEGRLILELKAVQTHVMAHEIQLVNYLTATSIDNGLLINFGSGRLQFKRKYRLYTKQH